MVGKHLCVVLSFLLKINGEELLEPKWKLNQEVPFELPVNFSSGPRRPEFPEIEPVGRVHENMLCLVSNYFRWSWCHCSPCPARKIYCRRKEANSARRTGRGPCLGSGDNAWWIGRPPRWCWPSSTSTGPAILAQRRHRRFLEGIFHWPHDIEACRRAPCRASQWERRYARRPPQVLQSPKPLHLVQQNITANWLGTNRPIWFLVEPLLKTDRCRTTMVRGPVSRRWWIIIHSPSLSELAHDREGKRICAAQEANKKG